MKDKGHDSFGDEINRRFENQNAAPPTGSDSRSELESPDYLDSPEIQPKESSPARTILISLLGVLLIVGLAGGIITGAVFLLDADSGPGHPEVWDERVLDLVTVVEQTRGLRFENPVFVEFLSDDEFRETVTNDADDLTEEDEEFYAFYAGLLRAYGVAEGDIDLFEENNDLYGDRIIGYYDNGTKKLTLRGEELTVEVKLTIVHELVHALQDQHFDLGRVDDLEGEEADAFRALVEGEARAVEDEYFETLDDDDQQAYIDSVSAFFDAEATDADEEGGPSPSILSASLSSSYVLGSNFIGALREDDGWRAINRAYDNPPTSMDHLMDPWRYINGDEIEAVPEPEIDGDDDSESDPPEPIGSLGWLFILSRVMDPVDALEVSDGWGGDIGIDYDRGDLSCFVDNLVGDTDADTDRFETAIQIWVEASPDDRSITRSSGVLTIKGCDPGADAEVAGDENSEDVLLLPTIRGEVTLGWLDSGADYETAACAGHFIVTQIPLELLSAEEFTAAEQTQFDAILERMFEACT